MKKEKKNGETPAAKKGGESKEHKKNWKEYTAMVNDIEQFLSDHVVLRRNVIAGRVECRIPKSDVFADWIADGLPTDQWLSVSDYIVNTLWRALSRQKKVKADDIRRIIDSDFSPSYNPFTYYLEHLPPWNGVDDYILELSLSVNVSGGVDAQMLFAECLRKWLVAMVAGWVDPKAVNHEILILIGAQGSYKTTWFDHLLPPELHTYFRIKTNAARLTKDDLIVLSQYGLVCCEELDTMRPSELNQLKSAVTMPSIDERKPYGHYTERMPHIASFCGTGNNTQFLTDTTGNRRWLPFEVASILSPRDHPFNYEGIYAQAYALYKQGFQYWFTQQDSVKLAEHNRQFETPRLENELVQLYFRKPVGREPGEFMPVSLALQVVGAGITQKLSAVSLGRAFVEMGFQRKTIRNVRGYVVVRRSDEERRSLCQAMAAGPDDTDTDVTDVL